MRTFTRDNYIQILSISQGDMVGTNPNPERSEAKRNGAEGSPFSLH